MGAGKSTALAAFARHGAAVISSDEIVHGLLHDDPEVKAAVVERLGESVLGPGGEIDRARVGERVFADPAELAWLEGLLHPRVAEAQARWRDEVACRPDPPAVLVAEIPLLYETGGETRFDAVVVVTAPPEVRRERLGQSVADRERRLVPDEEKVARADFAYVNDGSVDQLEHFVSEVMAKLSA